MTAFGLLTLLTLTGLNVEVTTLDGRSIDGTLDQWTSSEIIVDSESVAIDEVHRLLIDDSAEIDGANQAILFPDGSQLVVADFSRTKGIAQATVGTQTIQFDPQALKGVRFAPVEDRFSTTWRELLKRDRRDDLFVRVRGEALDHVGCVVGEVTGDGIALRVGSRDVTVPVEKSFGVLFATKAEPDTRIAGKVLLTDGTSLVASRLSWSDDSLSLQSSYGFSLTIPADQLAEVDLAAGRIEMLSNLEPRSVTYAPFGDNYDEYAWKLRKNENALGDRLRIGGQRRSSGLWIHSGTTVVYSLPSRAKQLSAVVGIDEIEAPGVPVKVELFVDGRKSFDAVVEPNSPRSIDLELTDARQLTIVATTTKPNEHGIREHLAIVDARLILE